jgi:ribonuclease VapC
MFIDSSPLCAILLGEDDGEALAVRIDQAKVRLTSHIAVMETALALARLKNRSFADVRALMSRFLRATNIETVDMPSAKLLWTPLSGS